MTEKYVSLKGHSYHESQAHALLHLVEETLYLASTPKNCWQQLAPASSSLMILSGLGGWACMTWHIQSPGTGSFCIACKSGKPEEKREKEV